MGALVFLQPFFLVALGAVAVPVLIHLIQRKRKKRIAFPTLRFLMQTDRRSARRYRLVDMLVMALRVALLGLLALALAQPMLRPRGTGAALGIPSLAIVIDDSLSMQATDGGARLFDKALEAARRVLSEMPQDGEAFVMLSSGKQPRGLAAPTSPPSSLIDALGTLSCSFGGRPLASAVNEAVAPLRQCKQPHKALIIIGDRQARELEEGAALDRAALEEVVHSATFVDVGGSAPAPNLGIVEAAAAPPVGLPGMPLRLRAKVFNSNDNPASATVTLWVNGEKSAERTLSLPARGPGEVAFTPAVKDVGVARAVLKLEPDALGADDTWYLPLRILPSVSALIVTPTGASAGETLYLRLALTPPSAARGGPAPVQFKETDYSKFDIETLSRYGVIFLFSAADLPATITRALDDYVSRGGVLVCFPALSQMRGAAAALNAAYAIGPVRQPASGEEAWSIDRFEKEHPLFALFAARAPSLVSDVSITAAVDLGSEAPQNGRVLAALPGGRALLTEIESGQGRRYVWATGCHPDWGDLPLRPLFVPLVFEMIKAAAAEGAQAPPTGNVDKGFTWDLPSPGAAVGLKIETPAGAKIDARVERGSNKLNFDQTDAPGFYTVNSEGREGTDGAGGTGAVVAGVNAAGEESDLRRAGDEEIKKYFPAKAEPRIVKDGGAAAQRLDYATRGVAFAHWLIGLALAALLAATWFANSLIRPEDEEGAKGSAKGGAKGSPNGSSKKNFRIGSGDGSSLGIGIDYNYDYEHEHEHEKARVSGRGEA